VEVEGGWEKWDRFISVNWVFSTTLWGGNDVTRRRPPNPVGLHRLIAKKKKNGGEEEELSKSSGAAVFLKSGNRTHHGGDN